jgi:hypothetical protein
MKKIEKVAALAQEYLDAEALVAHLKAKMEEAEAKLKILRERRIPDLMEDLEIPALTLKDGTEVEIEEKMYCGISKDREDEAMNWLDGNGASKLIKREFNIIFDKADEKWANKFEGDMKKRKRPLNCRRKRSVHWATLRSYVAEQIEKGVDIPFETFGVYHQSEAKVQAGK